MDQLKQELKPEYVSAILDEMQFWNFQLGEHARLIRSSVDLGEDSVIKEAEQFILMYDRLLNRLNIPGLVGNPMIVTSLLRQTKTITSELREFKMDMENGVNQCRIKAIVTPDLLNHIRREADYFTGKLNAVTSGPIPTWEDLGLDHLHRKVSFVPRMLLEEVENKLINQIGLEELLYWLPNSAEHANVLSSKFKPIEQAQFTQETLRFSAEFDRLHQQIFSCIDQRSNLGELMPIAMELNQSWINYLLELNRLLTTCQIPSRQANFWPALGVHIYREQIYFQSLLMIVVPRTRRDRS